jgi:hypothetical protein
MSASILDPTLPVSFRNPSLRNMGYTILYLLLIVPWESISMDYMFGLPSTKHGNDCVFVVIDQFSNMDVLTPYKKSITTEATTNILFEHVWVHFGLP